MNIKFYKYYYYLKFFIIFRFNKIKWFKIKNRFKKIIFELYKHLYNKKYLNLFLIFCSIKYIG